jgi:hypothetical protein
MYLGEPLFGRHGLAVWACGHIAPNFPASISLATTRAPIPACQNPGSHELFSGKP